MPLILLLEVAIILFLRKKMAAYFVGMIVRFGGSRSQAVWLYALTALPGVLSHEISHFLYAAFLGLRTGSIELLPQMDERGGVELGSVQVEKKDPLRLSLVGLAPLISGMILIAWLSSYIPTLDFSSFSSWKTSVQMIQLTAFHVLIMYLIMTISLHMTPSKRDMASWPIVAVLTFVFMSSFIFLGFKIPITQSITEGLSRILNQTAYGLALAILFAGVSTGLEYIGLLVSIRYDRRRLWQKNT